MADLFKKQFPGWENRAAMKAPTGTWGEIVNDSSFSPLAATVVILIGLAVWRKAKRKNYSAATYIAQPIFHAGTLSEGRQTGLLNGRDVHKHVFPAVV